MLGDDGNMGLCSAGIGGAVVAKGASCDVVAGVGGVASFAGATAAPAMAA